MRINRLLAFAGLCAVLCAAVLFKQQSLEANSLPTIKILSKNEEIFSIEVAEKPAELQKGLMDRKEMAANKGMLFIFPAEQEIRMWMRNTYIPLDMFFINSEDVIVGIKENATPLSDELISSGVPAKYALEVNAGTAKRLGTKKGDRVVIKK